MTADSYAIESNSPEETERLGYTLGGLLPRGSVVALRGDLASGKTCFVRGMAARFATNEVVSSPTFTLVNQYGDLYHVDLYRVSGPAEMVDLGYEELFDPEGICVVEWAERAEPLLPARRVDILFEHVDETSRRITVTNSGVLASGWAQELSEAF